MPLLKKKVYTTEDIYALPDGQRAELIDGQMYLMARQKPSTKGWLASWGRKLPTTLIITAETAKCSLPHSQSSYTGMIKIMLSRIFPLFAINPK